MWHFATHVSGGNCTLHCIQWYFVHLPHWCCFSILSIRCPILSKRSSFGTYLRYFRRKLRGVEISGAYIIFLWNSKNIITLHYDKVATCYKSSIQYSFLDLMKIRNNPRILTNRLIPPLTLLHNFTILGCNTIIFFLALLDHLLQLPSVNISGCEILVAMGTTLSSCHHISVRLLSKWKCLIWS